MNSFNNSFDIYNYISNDNIYYSPSIIHNKSGSNISQKFKNNFMIGNANLTNNWDSYLNKTIPKKTKTLLRSQSSIINGMKNEYSIPSKLFKGNLQLINRNKKKKIIPMRNKYINFIKSYKENVPNKESNYNRYFKSQLIFGDTLNNNGKTLKNKNNELFSFSERKTIKNKSKKKSKINSFRNIEKKYSQIFHKYRNKLFYKNIKNENYINLRKNESQKLFCILKQKEKSKYLNYTITKAENFQILNKNPIDNINNYYNNFEINHYSYLSKENIDNNNININELQKNKYNNLLSSFDYNNRNKPENISDSLYSKTPNIQSSIKNNYYNNKIINNNGNNNFHLNGIYKNNFFDNKNNNSKKYHLYFDYT